jgi:uridine kinase
MKRIVILGRGGAGKSTVAKQLSELTGLPYIGLDEFFWRPGLVPTPINEWRNILNNLVKRESWVMDGDLGRFDVLDSRLKAADTILVLDISFLRCMLRAIKRKREDADFWWWIFSWRWRFRPKMFRAIKKYAPDADVYIFRSPKEIKRFLTSVSLEKSKLS